jgi:hypothetical protein
VALLAAVATVLVTYIVGFPKRRLLYGMPVVAPLLRAPAGVRQDLELLHRGEALAAPHLLEIELISRGREDTPSSAYDSAKPMRLDVGARIVEVFRTTSHPESLSVPKVIVDGRSLMIGPSLIGKQQYITFTLLVDGTQPCLTCQSPLIDVQVRRLRPEDRRPVAAALPIVAICAIIPAAVVAALLELAAASRERASATLAQLVVQAYGIAAGLKNLMGKLGVKNAPSKPSAKTLAGEARAAAAFQASAMKTAKIDDWIAIALAAVAVAAVVIAVIMLRRRWLRNSGQ